MKRLSAFGILVLVIVVASAWGCGSTSTKEGTGEYVDDSVITTKVKNGDLQRPRPEGQRDQRRNVQGCGHLSGFVRSQADIDQAVKVSRGVSGVKSVKNDVRIK